jgi:hypothetical protein
MLTPGRTLVPLDAEVRHVGRDVELFCESFHDVRHALAVSQNYLTCGPEDAAGREMDHVNQNAAVCVAADSLRPLDIAVVFEAVPLR